MLYQSHLVRDGEKILYDGQLYSRAFVDRRSPSLFRKTPNGSRRMINEFLQTEREPS